MKWTTLCFSLICGLIVSPTIRLLAQEALPEWLSAADQETPAWQVSKAAVIDEPVVSAKLKFMADFARATVSINDQVALTVEPYCQLQSVDVTQFFILGENRVRIDVQAVDGPSAVAGEIEVKLASGQTRLIQTGKDSAWDIQPSGLKLATLEAVRPEMWGRGRRDATLSPVENYEQWRQALSDEGSVQPKFWTADGFEIALIRTAQADEGSWISLTFDAHRRAIISREDKGLIRLTLDSNSRVVERVEPIDIDWQECRGLAFHDGWLYANANNSKGLYRARIDEQGQVQQVERLRSFAGSVGHGRNDITIHQDWLYTIHGDSVDLPTENITDLTSPLRHLPHDTARREGQLLRMHLPTQKWELVCAGLRNPYGITAHTSGDLFTFDADNEFDMGTPWYRPTRLLGMYAGGDTGYRTAGNKLPPRFHDQPENSPPVLTIGRSSPTAVFHDTQLNFPAPYRDALYLLDWTYGRVLAVHLLPMGAGWRAQTELFLQGKPLNVTDVARGPDGAMYLITGGRKTQSSLYRISAKSDIGSRDVPAAIDAGKHAVAVAEFARQQRSKRQQLEEVSRQRDRSRLDFVASALGDADPVVRQAARIALERLPKDLWRNRALQPDTSAGNERLCAQLAFAQAMQPSDVPTLLTHWLQYDPHRFDLGQTIVWVRQCELMLGVDGPTLQARKGEVSSRLQSVWPMTTARHVAPEGTATDLRIRLAQLLGQLHSESALAVIASDLLSNPIQEERIAGLLAVRHQRTGWTTAMRRLQLEALRDTSSMIGGQGLPTFLEGIKADTLATLTDAEKEDLKLLLQPAQPAEQVEAAPVRPLVQKWQMKDLASLAESTGLAQPATGDAKADRQRGERIYREAQCIRCHRAGRIGRSVGPDLTYVGRRFSSRDLLESIVLPSRSVAENYRLDAVVTVDGTVHTGQIVVSGDYRSEKLLIQTDALRADSVVEIDKRDVEEHRQLERSPMPEGLLDHFSPAEIRDLLAYLQNPQ